MCVLSCNSCTHTNLAISPPPPFAPPPPPRGTVMQALWLILRLDAEKQTATPSPPPAPALSNTCVGPTLKQPIQATATQSILFVRAAAARPPRRPLFARLWKYYTPPPPRARTACVEPAGMQRPNHIPLCARAAASVPSSPFPTANSTAAAITPPTSCPPPKTLLRSAHTCINSYHSPCAVTAA